MTGLTYNLTYCLGYIMDHDRSYLQFSILFELHYGPWQGFTYNLTYCLSYIMAHDNGLTYNLAC